LPMAKAEIETHLPPVEFRPQSDGSLVLSSGHWKLQNASLVKAAPERIAQLGFDDSKWLAAVVPGTVLGSYVAAGAEPNPWFGDQMSQISDEFFSRNDFWYRDTFMVPADYSGRRIWLNFDGINWKAEVFLNGQTVGRIDGAFIRGRFDVTATAKPGTTNCLAVLIHRVAHPGPGKNKVIHKKLGSPTVNGDVLGADSPTFVASAGWNWLPIVRGRNIGIWNDVRLETSGDVTITDPWVTSQIPLPDTSRADLTVRTELCNHSTQPQPGKLVGTIGNVTFEQPVSLDPGETRDVTLDKANCPVLSLPNPHLWWPNGYGAQPLYTLNLRFECRGAVSDKKVVTFGIRKIDYKVINNVLTLCVNGKRILCRGGNWGMDEGMLNCDRAGYDLRVRLHHDANLNMIRNWVGMVGRQAFYDACDRYGILVWDDFWLANPVDGPDPDDHAMFMANARDKVRRVRSHAALALYCGRNEGEPPANLDTGMREATATLDGTRLYIPNSAAGIVTGHGPYEIKDVEWYFANRGKTFHSELGIVAVPVVESMRAMMPAENLWPINDMWAVHDYQSPRMPLYTQRVTQRYGQPTGIEDYCRKAQMVNMESAKAMYECLQANQGGGLLVWMTLPAWPSLICQLYDYYFEPTAAYFGARKACEPVHIFWNSDTDRIEAANDTVTNCDNLTAEAWIYGLDGKESWHKSVPIDLASTSVRECFPVQRPTDPKQVFFVKLVLRRGAEIISDNFYWSSGKGESCSDLNKLPNVTLPATASRFDNGQTCRVRVRISNPTRTVALMIRLKVRRDRSGDRILPVFYSDNYFSLLPGGTRDVTLEFAKASLAGESPKVFEEGWNVSGREIPLSPEPTNP
ncbi:MAG: sugar-binding domain-containing protein, partial [Verrucomicrobiia bacterium]